ncbi:MAG: hypothetical protein ACYCZF_00030 [Anaerolineae bacterium]
MSPPKRLVNLFLPVTVLTLACVLAYGFVLRLPFFFDDMMHFRWISTHSIGDILSNAQTTGYYRPLPFVIWKVLALALRGYNAPVFHSINLVLHWINALFVYALVLGRSAGGSKQYVLSLAVSLLFVLYPFSYQAVPFVGSLTHPLVLALILGTLLLFREGHRRCSKPLLVTSAVLALAAIFTHETGILIPALLCLFILTDKKPLHVGVVFRITWIYWLCAAIGIAVWLLVPKTSSRVEFLNFERIWQNTVYFTQGLAFPIAPMATSILNATNRFTDLQAIALVILPGIVLWTTLLCLLGRGRSVLFALGWFIIAAAPACLFLGFDYVIDGPRLLYTASVGAALFWAIPADLQWHGRWRNITLHILVMLFITVTGLSSYLFIWERKAQYEQMSLAVSALRTATQSARANKPILCVNFPAWLAPLDSSYAVGHEGVTIVPAYSSLTDLVWLNSGEERSIQSAILPDLLRHWSYNYTPVGSVETLDSVQALLRRFQQVVLARYDTNDISIYDAGGLALTGQEPSPTYLAIFDQNITLNSATWERNPSIIRVVLHWQIREKAVQDVTVFMHLYNEQGQLISQSDGYPVMNMSRPASWQPGDVWRDVRILHLPADLAAGEYTIKVGWYTTVDGLRLEATGPGGLQFQEDAVTIATIEIK